MAKNSVKRGSGVLYSTGKSSELPKDLVTWHDNLPYRVWIHSRQTSEGYRPMSVCVQWVGKEPSPVGELEKKLRLDTAVISAGVDAFEGLGPTSFRNIALGKLLEEHARLIASQRVEQRKKSAKRVNLVKDFTDVQYGDIALELKVHRLRKPDGKPLGANKEDSLFIAYVYAEQCANGSKMPASLTADVLGIDKSLVYVAVRTARKYGWLSKSVSGTAQGSLTESGKKELKRLQNGSFYAEFLKVMEGR